ncbi:MULTISPECIES: glucose PTS transporter subunit IIA [Sutcliffiella]|uniref:PTS beta-glucoside transporter subunit EIIBCA n=1 Tax=Sutcliffiella cohnii TaxID=33932 RepID=A0A223KTP5_9BACI|nr:MULTISPECIES: glucose PTS transporter subunit IIA [Sutcliffiella]AST92872.1 PTS beta-glucoside transporter subunit EIIBCA [Sutcliffiella cohnii]WBL14129.1 glucose PTS transporter subunit IIA [Sutcliffiella sp. NC1]
MSQHNVAKKESKISKILEVISGSFAPIIGVLAGAGLLKAALSVLSQIGWLSNESGTYIVLSAAGNSIFYFLPVFLGITIAIKLGGNGYVGGAIGAALLTPQIVNLVDTGVESISFLGLSVNLADYSSTVFPIFIAMFVYAGLEKCLKRIIYKDIQMFINPLISLAILVPLTMLFFGPFGNLVGEGLGAIITFLSDKSGLLAGAVLGGSWTFLTIAGLHWTIIPLAIANLANGPDPIIGMAAPAVFAQIAVAIAIFFKTRDNKLKSLAASGILPGALAGTTEAIYYGILLRYRKTIVYVVVAGAIGGAINGSFGVVMNDFVLPSVLSIPAFSPISQHLVGAGAAFVLGLTFTLVLGFQGKKDDTYNIKVIKPETVSSPLKGNVIPLADVNEPLFATNTVGKGAAIKPIEGKVYAPVDGEVTTLFPTQHALGITSNNGAEILIYVGIDTVKLNGQYFNVHIKQGDQVKKGDLLLEFDRKNIEKSGFDITTSVVITNTEEYAHIDVTEEAYVSSENSLLKLAL